MNRRMPLSACCLALCLSAQAPVSQAVGTLSSAQIISATASPSCMDWQVVGICYWLFCTNYGCSVRTSVKVRHFIPEVVVSSYSETGANPWKEVAAMSAPQPGLGAAGGGNAITPGRARKNGLRFKNADAIGHPGGFVLGQIQTVYLCQSATTAYVPYFLSTLDTLAWRWGVPESVYPQSLVPGMREIGTLGANHWGSVYPRGGFLIQHDDGKTAAVMAQRTADVISRQGQPHVYQSTAAKARPGWWPPEGGVLEGDASTHKWQALYPKTQQSCAVFPAGGQAMQSESGGYAYALWRPYRCCKREGQTFLFSTGH